VEARSGRRQKKAVSTCTRKIPNKVGQEKKKLGEKKSKKKKSKEGRKTKRRDRYSPIPKAHRI
jgi:hypothetical protein